MRAANMKQLLERRDQLRAEFEAAKARLDEVERLIRMFNGETPSAPSVASAERPRRGTIQNTVLDLITESGAQGLSVVELLGAAGQKRRIALDRGTVSSLLSRFKRDGIMIYDGARYVLKQHAGPREAA